MSKQQPRMSHSNIHLLSWLRPRQHVSGYFLIRYFFFRIGLPSTHTRWILHANLQLSEFARQTGGFVWTLNPDIFFVQWCNKIEPSSLPWICIQEGNFDASSLANISRRVQSKRVNSDTCRIPVDEQIRFEYGYVWTWKFLESGKKKLWI